MNKSLLTVLLLGAFSTVSHAEEHTTASLATTPLSSMTTKERISNQMKNNFKEALAQEQSWSLTVSTGLTGFLGDPQYLQKSTWWSNYRSGAIKCSQPFIHPNFAFTGGVGTSQEKYQFSEKDEVYYTLHRDHDLPSTVPSQEGYKTINSKISTTRFDVIAEVRWNSNALHPKEGFFVALGGKLGYLTDHPSCTYAVEHQEKKGDKATEEYQSEKEIDKSQRNYTEKGVFSLVDRWSPEACVQVGWQRISLQISRKKNHFIEEGCTPYHVGINLDLF